MTATEDRLPAVPARQDPAELPEARLVVEGHYALWEGRDGSWCLVSEAEGADEVMRAPLPPAFVKILKHVLETGETPDMRKLISPRELFALLRGM